MKRLAILVIPSVLAVLILGALVVPSFMDWNKYKPKAIEAVKQASGLDLIINGDVKLAILPSPRVSVSDAILRAPQGSARENIATVNKIDVHVALLPLLGGKIAVSSLSLEEPDIAIEKRANGEFNYMTPELKAKMDNKQAGAAAPEVSLSNVEIEKGVLTYIDSATGKVSSIENFDADLRADTLQGPYKFEGSLQYGDKTLALKGEAGRYNSETKTFQPKIEAKITPGDVEASFTGVVTTGEALNAQGEIALEMKSLAAALGQPAGSALDAPLSLQGMMTATPANVSVKNATVNWRGQKYENATLEGGFGGDALTFAARADEIPGDGALDVKGTYAAKSKTLDMTVDVSTANLPITAQALAGKEAPYANIWKSVKFSGGVEMRGDTTVLKNGAASLDGMQVGIAGSYTKSGARPKASVVLTTSALDWDNLQQKLGVKKTEGEAKDFDPNALAQSLKLPVDLDFDLSAQNIKASGYSAGGARAKGALRENSIALENLALTDFAGANLSASGKIADLKSLSGIDMNLSGKASDVKKLAQVLKIKTDSLPAQLSSAEGQAKLSGNLTGMNMNANVSALGGQVAAQGVLSNPLTALEISGLKLQVKHRSAAEAIRIFSPGFNGPAGLSRPMDISAEVNRSGKSVQLANIKGQLAGADVKGSLDVNNEGAKPAVKGSFQFGALVLEPAKAEKAPSGGSGGGSSGSSGEMRWSREAIDSSWMNKMDADIDITAQSLVYGSWNLQKPVLKASLKGGELNVSQLDAGLYGGSLTLNGKMRSGGSERQPLYVEGAGKFSNVELEEMVRGFVGSRILKASGKANMDFKITSSGISPAALIYDLAGNGTVTGSAITLENVDVNRFARALSEESKPGDSLLQLWKGTTNGAGTSFETLDGNFTISEGVVNIAKMDLDGARSSIKTVGTVNLPRWTIATTHTITVKDRTDVPPFDVKLSGPLDNPGQTFAQGVLQDYLNRKIQRKIGSVISDKLGDKGGALGQLLGLPQKSAPAPAPVETAPTEGQAEPAPQSTQQAPAPQSDEDAAQEAVKGLIKGLMQ